MHTPLDNSLLKKTLIFAAFSSWTSAALTAGLTVTPATITNDYTGKITLTITELASGKRVIVEKYGDVNTNGVIDPGEPLFQSYAIADGQLPLIGGVRNLNVPGDEDGATNGQIYVVLFYPGLVPILDFIAGTYLFKVSDPVGGFTPITHSFVVKQKLYPQGVVGQLTIAGTGAPLTNAIVLPAPPNGSPVSVGVADANGNYTFYGAPGGFAVVPVKPSFVADFDAGGVFIPANQVVSKNLALAAATRTISGQVRDSATGSGLGGVMVRGEAAPNLFAGVFSDAAGNFVLPVSAAPWNVRVNRGQLAQQGYVGWDEGPTADTSGGNVGNVNFAAPKANALIFGTLRDTQNQPVAGFAVGAKQHDAYEAAGRAFATNANFCLGVIAGEWGMEADSDDHIDSDDAWQRGLVGQDLTVTISNGETKSNLTYVARRATAQISGQVRDDLGQPLAGARVWASASRNGTNYFPGGSTDNNGHYQVGVFNALWQVGVDCNPFTSRGLNCPSSQSTNVAGANVVVNFTATDTAPPALAASTPANNQTGVATNAVIAVSNGKLYVMFASDNPFDRPLRMFDPLDNTWSDGPPIPTQRTGLVMAAVDDKIFTIGGWFWPSYGMPLGLPTVEQFSPPRADRITSVVFKSDATTLAAGLGFNLTQPMYRRLDAGDVSGLTFQSAIITNTGSGINLEAVDGAVPGTQVITIPPGNGQSGFFKTSFVLPPGFIGGQLSLAVNADDQARAFINGYPITSSMTNASQRIGPNKHTFCVTKNPAWLKPGTNELIIANARYASTGSGVMFYGFITYQMVPRFRLPTWAGPGQFQLQVDSVTNETYSVQVSADLMTWNTLLTTNGASGAIIYTDISAHDRSRYYRVKVEP